MKVIVLDAEAILMNKTGPQEEKGTHNLVQHDQCCDSHKYRVPEKKGTSLSLARSIQGSL